MMDLIYRRSVLQRELRVLNQKEDRDLQFRLSMLDKQHRCTCRMLQQRRDSLLNERRKVVMVKICEPKATVGIAMREIGQHRNLSRVNHTSDGRIYQNHGGEAEPTEQNRSISAPPVQPSSSVRHRGNIQSSVSLRQMKNIAGIDSISQKELERRHQRAREEMESLRQLQRETLHKRVTAFIEKLKDKGNVEIPVEPP